MVALLVECLYTPLWFNTISPSGTPLQCHHKLGHPYLQKLPQVLPIESSITTLKYDSCQLGKQHRASYSNLVNNRSSSLFNLLHSHIWGPCRFTSVSSFWYFSVFEVFIDDFSRMSWVYLLKNRTHVSDVIKKFITEIKIKLYTIRVLRTDNVLEFTQKEVSRF